MQMLGFPNRLRRLIKLKLFTTPLQNGGLNSVQLALIHLEVLRQRIEELFCEPTLQSALTPNINSIVTVHFWKSIKHPHALIEES